tara:strand:+ start:3268 stop:3843 length:576 start_codon:yes stop_codon:yes gene_type:complete
MKKIIKLSLFLLIIITSTIFYRYFFLENEKSSLDIEIPNEQVVENPESNIIKNLKYEVKLADQNKYIITSELSEITEKNGPEIVIMKIATAVFLDKKNIPLKVTSDIAEYNNETHNTNFSQNVRIEYLNNIILADKMDFDFVNNLVKIYQNVEYKGLKGNISTDNIEIDLITKQIKIYMDNTNNNVKVVTK